jgi:predicted FMN-binding regulatory protein PaiB
LEGKFKMSQNKKEEDQQSVMEHLSKGSYGDKEVADMMELLRKRGTS